MSFSIALSPSVHAFMNSFTRWLNRILFAVAVILLWAYFSGFRVAFDPQEELCLPGMRWSLLHEQTPRNIKRGEIVFWSPHGAAPLADRKLPVTYAIKRVAGVSGDFVQVSRSGVRVNGELVAVGSELIQYYPGYSEKNFTLGENEFFVLGEHPLSDDSRYWGVLDRAFILGTAHAIF